jgi:phospholipid transport system substrate-binding protein
MIMNRLKMLVISQWVFLGFGLILSQSVLSGQDPHALVKDTTEKMFSILKRDRDALVKSPEKVVPLVEELLLPHFDFHIMSRSVLGKNWKQASETQKQDFSTAFRNLLVRTYAKALLEFVDVKIDYLPGKENPKRKVLVKTEVEQPGGFPIPLDYRLRETDKGEWLIYDVIIDGLSLVIKYRSSFKRQIAKNSLDQLIESLKSGNVSRK